MSQPFEEIWKRFIGLCVSRLPWDATVDFNAHVWPTSHAGVVPMVPFSAKFSEISSEVFTAMRVRLHGHEIELKYFPAGELWRCWGSVGVGFDKVLSVEISPKNGVLVRGVDKLDELADQALTWLLSHGESPPSPVVKITDVVW